MAGWLGFEWRVALRFLREGRMQSVLIIVGVAAGVAVIAYVTALIDGLQANTVRKTLGTQAHVALRAPDDSLTPAQVKSLHEAMQQTLTEATQRARSADLGKIKAEKHAGLRVHNRTGEPCDVCGTPIAQVRLADSAFQYCPTCQTGGKPLADRRMSRLLK